MNGDIESTNASITRLIEAAVDAIMLAKQSDAFTQEACEKILRDAVISDDQAIPRPQPDPRVEKALTDYDEGRALGELPAQPKSESWQEIAREAVNRYCDPPAIPLEQIILAAIARSHAAQPQASKALPRGSEWRPSSEPPRLEDFKPTGHVLIARFTGSEWKINLLWRHQDTRLMSGWTDYTHWHKITPPEKPEQPQPSKASPLGERSESWIGGKCAYCNEDNGNHRETCPLWQEISRELDRIRELASKHSDQPPSLAKATDDNTAIAAAYEKGRQHNDVCIADPLRKELTVEREKRDRITVDSQSWGGLRLEWRESDGRHYLYDKFGKFLWSGEPSYNIWKCVKLTKELAAERELREQDDRLWRGRYNDTWQQLLSALAAIEKHNQTVVTKVGFDCYQIDVDLSALREHDAEKDEMIRNLTADLVKATDDLDEAGSRVKPLVDALNEIADDCEEVSRDTSISVGEKRTWMVIAKRARALAKAKQ